MSEIHHIAERFRNAIDLAVSNRELTIYPFSKFPKDCCDMTSDLLSQYLSEYGINTEHINGVYRNDHQLHHVWIRTMDGIVIDITGDQFNGKPNMPNNIEPIHVGEEGTIHRMFCKDRKREDPTEFVGNDCYDQFLGQPTRRQRDLLDAYNIIKRYL